MNYFFLKNIVISLTNNFICPNCKTGKPQDETLDVKNITTSSVELAFVCPNCGEKSLLKAEASQMNPQFLSTDIGKKFIDAMNGKWWKLMVSRTKKQWIPTEDLKKFQEKLQKSITVEELMDEN